MNDCEQVNTAERVCTAAEVIGGIYLESESLLQVIILHFQHLETKNGLRAGEDS